MIKMTKEEEAYWEERKSEILGPGIIIAEDCIDEGIPVEDIEKILREYKKED